MLEEKINNISILVAIKSHNVDLMATAYNFTVAALKNPKLDLKMVFLYQDAAYLLSNPKFNDTWNKLIIEQNITVKICKGSCEKRGILIPKPFEKSSLIEFISICENIDRIIQF